MKNRYINLIALIAIVAFSFSCGGDTVDPVNPSATELQLKSLMNDNASWSVGGGSVVKDGYNVTNQFDGFTIAIGEFTFTTQNGLETAWPSTGTWEFINDNPNKILRSDGVEIEVNIINNDLILTFNVTGISGGRVKGIDGNYTFTLSSN